MNSDKKPVYSIEDRDIMYLRKMRKKSFIEVVFITEPFIVETQEGSIDVNPETVDDWENGYYVAFPDDGSKPYPISAKFIRENYERVEKEIIY